MVTVKKRILSVVICMAMFITCFAALGMVQRVHASAVDDLSTPWEVTYYPNKKSFNYFYVVSTNDVTIDMATVSVSNPAVAELIKKKMDSESETYYVIHVKKAGKATITVKAKEPNAGDETYVTKKIPIHCVKYVNAIKSFKIGKKEYKKKFKKVDYFWQQKKVAGKLNIKVKKGWKIKKIWFYNYADNTQKKIKNGKKITLKKNTAVIVWVKKKGKNVNMYYQVGR